MSGTSADGLTAAIVDFLPRGQVKLLAWRTYPYPPAVRRRVFALFDPATARVDEICRMNMLIGELFAAALLRLCETSGIAVASLDLIGSHGQTIHHLPRPAARPRGQAGSVAGAPPATGSTLQIGEPSVIAERTGVTTVADFRPRDMAAGGQGAPLVPLADLILFGHPRRARALQNIGGIANVTYLPAGGAGEVLAFDTGPGNMVIDRLTSLYTRGRQSYDRAGRIAASGAVDERLLRQWLRHPYLRRRPPKTTGREDFGVAFADRLVAENGGRVTAELIATATAFTARSIADAYRRLLPRLPDEAILCGGGAHNAALVAMLRAALPGTPVALMQKYGIDPEAKEAVSFAILARQTMLGLPGNVPSATGARRPVVLGKIVPGQTCCCAGWYG